MKQQISEHYRDNSQEIQDRIKEFQELREAPEERLFRELVFVILTSQSSARSSWDAAEKLDQLELLREPERSEIAAVLEDHGIRYEERKASYIVENRKKLSHPTLEDPSGSLKLRERIDPEDLDSTREWLVENLKGIGWKGASHFLRNIGYGNSFAIISGHIVSQLSEAGIIEERPSNREQYLRAEKKLQDLSRELDIPVQELDLVLWSMETGEVFK